MIKFVGSLLLLFSFANSVAASSFTFSKLPENDCDALLLESALVHEMISDNRFETSRTMVEYKSLLGPNFENALHQLKDGETWIDMGAGFGLAQIGYRTSFSAKANLIATAFVRPSLEQLREDFTNKQMEDYIRNLNILDHHLRTRLPMPFRYVEGDVLRHGSKLARKGTVRLITDLFGPMSYVAEPARLLRLYGNMLALNARLFIHVLDDRLQIRDPKTGRNYTLFQFVAKFGRGFYFAPESRYLVRNEDEIFVPDLKVVKRLSGTPPYNTYEIVWPTSK